MKRLLEACVLAALIATLGLAVSGCGQREEKTPDGRTILTFWHTYNEEEEKIFKGLVTDWEKDNASWTIRPVRLPFDGHKPKLRTALTVGRGPDMARVDWSFVCELGRKNALVDLETFGFSKIRDTYLQAPLGTNLIDGVYRGFPEQTNCVALFYNKKMFREAGLDPETPPRTWEEFIDVGKKLTNAKGEFGFAMDNTLWWTLPFPNGFGATVIASDGKTCLLDGKEAIAAMELKSSLFNTHKIEAGAWRAGSITPEQGFINGKYAMIFCGPWNLPKFGSSGIDFGVALIPAGPAGSSSNVGGNNVVILKSSRHPQQCYNFLAWFTSAPVQARWCQALQQVPINLAAYDLVTFDNPHLKVFMEQLKTSKSNPVVTNYEVLEDIVNPEMEAIITGQKTAAAALANAARKVEKKVLRF